LEPQGLPAARPTSVTQPVLIKPALREANGITSTTPTASGTISPTATATPGAAGATGPTLRVTATAAPARPGPAPAPAATAALVRSTATPAAARADALYREAIAMEPRSAERLAKVEQAAGLAPTAVLYVRQLASEYYQRGRYEDCSAQCDRALALEGQEGQAGSMLLTLKATALYELGRLEASREANEAALRADPTNHWARHNLAVTLTAQNSPRAAQAWRDYIERAKDDPEQRLLLDEARRKLADLERAGR
jgi:tetratricopeptide (TPR) repeat protein